MTAPDYREQALALILDELCPHRVPPPTRHRRLRTRMKAQCPDCLAAWASRIAEERDGLSRSARFWAEAWRRAATARFRLIHRARHRTCICTDGLITVGTPAKTWQEECPFCAHERLLREALSKNGPRAHAGDCASAFGGEAPCSCWLGRARRLLGEGRGP